MKERYSQPYIELYVVATERQLLAGSGEEDGFGNGIVDFPDVGNDTGYGDQQQSLDIWEDDNL
ncbi:MAG: hypothetical protein MR216_08975 [Bacteroidales bacterium]|nr:hypothetical protein [Bacteroidales bacterium]